MGKRKKTHTVLQNLGIKEGKNNQVFDLSFSLFEDENDFISNFPDELLSLILSHLPLHEAVRTSILSKRWRHVWNSVPKLEFDANNITGSSCNARTFRTHYQDKFVACVNQVLQLHQPGCVKSFKLQCNLGSEYYSQVDKWLQFAVNNAIQNLHFDLSKPREGPLLPMENCYEIPSWIFQGALMSFKHLSLSSCTFKVPSSSTCFSSLASLSLASLDLSQDHVKILCNCPNIQSVSLLDCICPYRLELSRRHSHQFLPLKHLHIFGCRLAELEIVDATGLLSFECVGTLLKGLTLQNSAKPINISYGHLFLELLDPGPFYDFERLVVEFPEVEKLMLVLPLLQGNVMSLRLPTMSRLQELMVDLTYQCADNVFKFLSSLLKASP